jgi:hypothetical protein
MQREASSGSSVLHGLAARSSERYCRSPRLGGNTVTPGGSCSAEAVMDLYVNGSMDHEWDLWAYLFSFSLSF